jgi:hypothetical protein
VLSRPMGRCLATVPAWQQRRSVLRRSSP